MGRPERLAVWIDHQDRIAGFRLAVIQNIARENPGMAGSDTASRFPADAHCVQVSSLPITRNQKRETRNGFSYFTGSSTGTLEAPLTLTITG